MSRGGFRNGSGRKPAPVVRQPGLVGAGALACEFLIGAERALLARIVTAARQVAEGAGDEADLRDALAAYDHFLAFGLDA